MAEEVLHRAGAHTLRTYVVRIQATVAEKLYTQPIFDVCDQETGFEGGGRLWVIWWGQKDAEDQLRVAVEAISSSARVWRRQ